MTLIIELAIVVGIITLGLYQVYLQNKTLKLVVLGTGYEAAKVLREVEDQDLAARYEILGFVKTAESENSISRELRIESEEKLLQLSKRLAVDVVVIAVDEKLSHKWVQQLLDCKLGGVKILDASMLDLYIKQQEGILKNA